LRGGLAFGAGHGEAGVFDCLAAGFEGDDFADHFEGVALARDVFGACIERGGISYPWQESSVDISMRFTGVSGDTTEEGTRHVVPAAPDRPAS